MWENIFVNVNSNLQIHTYTILTWLLANRCYPIGVWYAVNFYCTSIHSRPNKITYWSDYAYSMVCQTPYLLCIQDTYCILPSYSPNQEYLNALIPVSPECLSVYTSCHHFGNLIMQGVVWLRFGKFATRWRGVSESLNCSPFGVLS